MMTNFDPVSHVIFDVDGLLLDTVDIFHECHNRTVNQFGHTISYEQVMSTMGYSSEETRTAIRTLFNLPITNEEYAEIMTSYCKEQLPSTKLMPDTVNIIHECHNRTLAQFGHSISYEQIMSMMGYAAEETKTAIRTLFNLPVTNEEYTKIMEQYSLQLVLSSKLMPGAERLVRHLDSCGIPIAVASGGSDKYFQMKITQHRELFKLFRHVVLASTDDEVKRGKPAPDVFTVCAHRFSDRPDPRKCLVFEDAPNGVVSAAAAGMQVVLVPDARLPEEQRCGATQVISSLEDFQPELFGLPAFET